MNQCNTQKEFFIDTLNQTKHRKIGSCKNIEDVANKEDTFRETTLAKKNFDLSKHQRYYSLTLQDWKKNLKQLSIGGIENLPEAEKQIFQLRNAEKIRSTENSLIPKKAKRIKDLSNGHIEGSRISIEAKRLNLLHKRNNSIPVIGTLKINDFTKQAELSKQKILRNKATVYDVSSKDYIDTKTNLEPQKQEISSVNLVSLLKRNNMRSMSRGEIKLVKRMTHESPQKSDFTSLRII